MLVNNIPAMTRPHACHSTNKVSELTPFQLTPPIHGNYRQV